MNSKDLDLAYKLRHALDQSAGNLPTTISDRLASSRSIALSRKKQAAFIRVPATEPQHAGHAGYLPPKRFSWIAVAAPLAVLVFGLIGIYQFEQRQHIIDLAILDAEVLTDDLPISAYLDNGFGVFLAKEDD